MRKKSVLFFLLLAGASGACVKHDLVTPTIQLKKDTDDIANYLSTNNIDAIKIPQGVWYWLDTPGSGPYPVLSDSVKVLFYARQIRPSTGVELGDTIDTSITDKSETQTVLLSAVISGMQIGLERFPVGTRGRLYIPSGLAFGVTGKKAIPPNANLLYEIELEGAAGSRLAADTVAVGNYVRSIAVSLLLNKYQKIRDPSGVWYSYDTIYQASVKPTPDKNVTVDVTAQILGASTPFHSVTDTTFALNTTPVTAFRIVLPKISVGTTVTIYVPSGYGYGALSPSTAIPANSNLIYTVTLKSVF